MDVFLPFLYGKETFKETQEQISLTIEEPQPLIPSQEEKVEEKIVIIEILGD